MCNSRQGVGAASGADVVATTCAQGVTAIDDHPILPPIGLERGPQLAAVIVPLAPGKVVLHGVRLTYQDQGRTRTEHTGTWITIEATAARP